MLGSISREASLKNCKAENVDIRSVYAVGGLVGKYSVTSSSNIAFENCSVTNATLWITSLGEEQDYYKKTVGSIVGYVSKVSFSGKLTLKNCTASDITYKVGTQATEGAPYIIEDSEEGNPEYGPTHDLYGYCDEKVEVTVENDEP